MAPSGSRTATGRPAQPDGRSRSSSAIRLLLIVVAVAWLVRSLILAPFSIPTGSMLPTLFVGDYVMVGKWPYGYSRYSFPLGIPSFDGRILGDLPERGDIAVFRGPGEGGDYVKRVVGLPGDEVGVRGGMLVLNGRGISREPAGMIRSPISPNSPCRVVAGATPRISADQSACLYPAYRETLPNGRSYLVLDQVENPRVDEIPPTIVPKGHVFVLGDNRDDSLDSRFSSAEGGVGLVPLENLIGRAFFVFWSTDGSADYLKPWTWFSALRADRIGPISTRPER